MDCKDCKLEMVRLFDRNVDQEILGAIMDHLIQCPGCAEEYRLTRDVVNKLKPRLLPKTPCSLKQSIIDRIEEEAGVKRNKTKVRWLDSRMKKILSLTAVLILAMLIVPFTIKNDGFINSTAKAADKLIEMSIEASRTIQSMVIKLKVRTIPRDNFELVGTEYEMVEHTITKSFQSPAKWRIDKGERVVVCDGNYQYLWLPNFEKAIKAGINAGFIRWFKMLLDPQSILSREQTIAKESGSKITMEQKGDEILMTVTSSAKGNFINDYCKYKSIEESDNRREYTIDRNSKLLKGLKIYIIQGEKETLIVETEKIDYDVQIDPSLFTINLPDGISWKEPTNIYSSQTFRNITSKQAAEIFFQAIAENNWQLAGETCDFFDNSSKKINDLKEFFGGLTIINIGEPFKSGQYGGEFVPYEIRFKSGDVKKMNLALRNDNPNKVWRVDGGF